MFSNTPIHHEYSESPEPDEAPPASTDVPPLTRRPWHELWSDALFNPSVRTYSDLLNEVDRSGKRVFGWYVATILLGLIITLPVALFFSDLPYVDVLEETMASMLFALFCGLPLAVGLGYVGFLIGVGLSNIVATSIFNGQGTYWDLVFAVACYTFPLSVITNVLSIFTEIPVISCVTIPLTLGLSLYYYVLNVISIQAVHKLKWWEALLSSAFAISVALVLVCGGCVLVIVLLGGATS